jgi:hypothetical protein
MKYIRAQNLTLQNIKDIHFPQVKFVPHEMKQVFLNFAYHSEQRKELEF